MYVFYVYGIDKIYAFCTRIYSNRAISAMHIILQQFHSLPNSVWKASFRVNPARLSSFGKLYKIPGLEHTSHTSICSTFHFCWLSSQFAALTVSQYTSLYTHTHTRIHTNIHIFAKFKAVSIKQMPKSRISVLKGAHYTLIITDYTFTVWGNTTTSIHFRICFVLSRGPVHLLYKSAQTTHCPITLTIRILFMDLSELYIYKYIHTHIYIIVAFILNMQFSLMIFFSDWSKLFSLSEVSLHGYSSSDS